eukprot:10869155-Alexandrium_andersonii.AAC.1
MSTTSAPLCKGRPRAREGAPPRHEASKQASTSERQPVASPRNCRPAVEHAQKLEGTASESDAAQDARSPQ